MSRFFIIAQNIILNRLVDIFLKKTAKNILIYITTLRSRVLLSAGGGLPCALPAGKAGLEQEEQGVDGKVISGAGRAGEKLYISHEKYIF